MRRPRLRTPLATLVLAACLAQAAVAQSARAAAPSADSLLARTRARYAALRSYADRGTMLVEYGAPGAPVIAERHAFTTLYRAPREFLFDFRKDPQGGGERIAVWCDGGDFQSWWSATGVHERYAQGRGTAAFAVASYPTDGAVLIVAPLLFAQAGLHGVLADFAEPRLAGTDSIRGRPHHRLAGVVRLVYASGGGTGGRPTTLWIDAQTLLVHRIVEESPEGTGAGTLMRTTTTLEPQADPAIDAARFRFTIPARP